MAFKELNFLPFCYPSVDLCKYKTVNGGRKKVIKISGENDMAIPDFQAIMLPLLELVKDGQEHSGRKITEQLADYFQLTEADRQEMLNSNRQLRFTNRVSWAKAHLGKAGLITTTRRGHYKISDLGLTVLAQKPPKINVNFLQQFPEYAEFRSPSEKINATDLPPIGIEEERTPEEVIDSAYQNLRQKLASEILEIVKAGSPKFFEQLVVDLLVKMGYGGTRKEAGRVIGQSGDGGIDGIINEDRLGLDVIYIQAKRWEGTVGRPELQKFVGALLGQGARKGVFITTSYFSQSARDYVDKVDSKIVLIDGDLLPQLMIDYNVGVTVVTSYDLKRIDSDYFSEDYS
jgi:restriction system protein